jgi:hypothetical protein
MMSLLGELFSFVRIRRKYWLAPLIAMMALMSGLIVLAKGSAVAPFIYTLF